MLGFIGEYECKVDVKGRLLFPAGLRKQLQPADGESFVVNKGFEKCLMLYPKSVWEARRKPIDELNPYVKKNRDFKRAFYNGAREVGLDSNARLLLPKTLMDYAGMKKELILFAHGDEIEIWDKKEYDKIDSANFSDLAEEVLGKDVSADE
jgi:MraZ protein